MKSNIKNEIEITRDADRRISGITLNGVAVDHATLVTVTDAPNLPSTVTLQFWAKITEKTK